MFDLIHKKYTMYKLLVYLLLYINIWLSFTVVYFILDVYELGLVVDHYASDSHQISDWDLIKRSLYLSAITLLSVGYGDVTPFGLSRAVAMIQALIGYLLPVVIVFNLSLFFIVEKNKS